MLIIASSLLLLQGLVMAAETTDDYRQPYKFVKPLTELNEMYRRRVVTPEAEKKMPIAEARTGFSSRMDDMVEDNMEEESEMAIMTSSLKAPPPVSELLPKPVAADPTHWPSTLSWCRSPSPASGGAGGTWMRTAARACRPSSRRR